MKEFISKLILIYCVILVVVFGCKVCFSEVTDGKTQKVVFEMTSSRALGGNSVYVNGVPILGFDDKETNLKASIVKKGKNNLVIDFDKTINKSVKIEIKEKKQKETIANFKISPRMGHQKYTFEWRGFRKTSPMGKVSTIETITKQDREVIKKISSDIIQSTVSRDEQIAKTVARTHTKMLNEFIASLIVVKKSGNIIEEGITLDRYIDSTVRTYMNIFGQEQGGDQMTAKELDVSRSEFSSKIILVRPAKKRDLYRLTSHHDDPLTISSSVFAFGKINGKWTFIFEQ